ncbi:MAG: hypothetical protein JZU55_15420, partial [Afipia sp.]|nr:hypothetical protein [Afipia sp.]
KIALGMVVWLASSSVKTGALPTRVPSVVFDVPKSSPQADIVAPEKWSVYPLRSHRSTTILHEFADAPTIRRRPRQKRPQFIHRSIFLGNGVDESTICGS